MNSPAVQRAHIHFSGHVQGVGFRYTVMQTAKGYDVTGLVENLPDGRVHLVAEGAVEEIDGFVAAIGERMTGYIRKVDRLDETGVRLHRGFSIR